MKVSVLIPAYNCSGTIKATLDSVLRQTAPADEILVMNDGSTDETASILDSYKPKITVFSQPNQGIASARNGLVARAKGDLIAFLDSDDLWHPKYLEVQRKIFEAHPTAVAFFTGHVDIYGNEDYRWINDAPDAGFSVEVISPLDFFERYNRATGPFACFSYCCVPQKALRQLGEEPFKEKGAEDSYCFCLLALLGPVVYSSVELAAYRVREGSLSHDHLWSFGLWVHVFELLEEPYKKTGNSDLWRAFQMAFAAKRRSYAKLLMGAGMIAEARGQLRQSLGNSSNPISATKSLGMLFFSYMPKPLQPTWPPSHREWKVPGSV